MNIKYLKFAVDMVADRLGLAVSANVKSDANGEYVEYSPADAHPNEAFILRFRPGWRSVEIHLALGQFSGPLVSQMARCSADQKKMFALFAAAMEAQKIKILMRINGTEAKAANPDTWPILWEKFELGVRLTAIVVDIKDDAQSEKIVSELLVPFFAMMAALIGVEESDTAKEGETEGNSYLVITKRYERKKINREACIQLKGLKCTACGFDFSEKYGILGAGYIEVHHTTPISEIGADYRIDVAKDLEPLCSNCHSMIHRPPQTLTSRELKILIDKRAIG